MKAAPLELFYWNRLVVDEYTYNKERDYTAIVQGLQASSRWVLSGTPDISGFAAVNETAQWLGLHLGSADAADLTSKEKKEQSAVERFQYFRDSHTPAERDPRPWVRTSSVCARRRRRRRVRAPQPAAGLTLPK